MNITELQQITNNFVTEIQAAQAGSPSSLPFIVHTLQPHAQVGESEPFEVLVVGGSVFQTAKCRIVKGKTEILNRNHGDKPVFNTDTDFYNFLDLYVDPSVSFLAINFAYPLTPVMSGDILDGILQHGTKENAFLGLTGKPIGQSIAAYLKSSKGIDVKVSVANDTICTLMAGLHDYPPDALACGIVGTGVNFAYFIDPKHPVNLESANFNKFTQSPYGKKIDMTSALPGKGLFEKEISGAYLHLHFNQYAQEHNLREKISSTLELDEFAKSCNGSGLCEFTQEILDRSAAYVAVQAAAITRLKNTDMTFVMSGSLFWRAWGYREKVINYIKQLVPEHSVHFVQVESCEILGAAKLAG